MKTRIEEMIKKLNSSEPREQVEAVEQLVASRSEDAVEPLIGLLHLCLGRWEKRFLTSSIVEALGKLGSKKAEEVLLKALDSNLLYVKKNAAEAIEKIVPTEAGMNKLVGIVKSDQPKEVKKDLVKALGKTKNKLAVSPLEEFYYRETDEKLRSEAIAALSKIPDVSSAEFLIQVLTDENPETRSCAALALGETRNRMGEEPLKRLLTDPVEKVRKSAVQALGLIKALPKQRWP